MADDLFEQPDDATPLRPEEAAALRAPVVDRRQLNEIEAAKVGAGRALAMRSRKDCLTDNYICELHKKMFGDVWRWAGDYRTFDVNIGNTQFVQVPVEVRQALGDARYWMDQWNERVAELTVYSPAMIPRMLQRRDRLGLRVGPGASESIYRCWPTLT